MRLFVILHLVSSEESESLLQGLKQKQVSDNMLSDDGANSGPEQEVDERAISKSNCPMYRVFVRENLFPDPRCVTQEDWDHAIDTLKMGPEIASTSKRIFMGAAAKFPDLPCLDFTEMQIAKVEHSSSTGIVDKINVNGKGRNAFDPARFDEFFSFDSNGKKLPCDAPVGLDRISNYGKDKWLADQKAREAIGEDVAGEVEQPDGPGLLVWALMFDLWGYSPTEAGTYSGKVFQRCELKAMLKDGVVPAESCETDTTITTCAEAGPTVSPTDITPTLVWLGQILGLR